MLYCISVAVMRGLESLCGCPEIYGGLGGNTQHGCLLGWGWWEYMAAAKLSFYYFLAQCQKELLLIRQFGENGSEWRCLSAVWYGRQLAEHLLPIM